MSRLAPRVRVARVVPARARRSRALARASSADASSSAARVASLRAILGLDDRALRQLDRTVEGRAVRDDVPLGALAERVRALSAALPRACARHAFELVVERPGLLTTDASATRAAIERAANALGGAEQLERLCAECAPAFAHVLWRVGAREGTLAECERPLRDVGGGRGGLASRLHAENRERVGVLVDARTNGDERDGGERRRVSGTRRPGRASRFGRAPISARARRRRMTDATATDVRRRRISCD